MPDFMFRKKQMQLNNQYKKNEAIRISFIIVKLDMIFYYYSPCVVRSSFTDVPATPAINHTLYIS